MPLDVSCPNCQTRYSLPEKFAGKKLKCKSCSKPFLANAGAAKAAGTRKKKTAQRTQPSESALQQMGLRPLPKQPELFPAQPFPGPDPLRNHVVQDPGFESTGVELAGTAGGLAAEAAARNAISIDDDEAAVVANPYAAPKRVSNSKTSDGSSEKGNNRRRQSASLGKRFLGFVIDSFVLGVLSFGATFVIALVMGLAGLIDENSVLLLNVIIFFVNLAIFISYFVLMEGLLSATLGKLALGTRVADVNGGKASFGKIFIRTLCRIIPFEAFSFLFGGNWHDLLSGTQVVNT